jgi:hypothetical protein
MDVRWTCSCELQNSPAEIRCRCGKLHPLATGQLYEYYFAMWVDEPQWRDKPAWSICHYLKMKQGGIAMVTTEEMFNEFRDKVNECGFSLREIERVPYVEPEVVA